MPCSWILRIAHSNSAARLVFLFHWARLSCESDSSPMTRPRQPIVVGDPDAALAEPLLVQRCHPPEQLLGIAAVGGEVVVHEQQVAAQPSQFVDDLVDGTRAEPLVEEGRDRAEAALVRATPRRLHRVDGCVAPPLDQRAVGDRQPRERNRTGHIPALQRSVAEVRDHPRHRALGFADANAVGVLRGFVGQQARVVAAHHDGFPLRPEPVGDFVGPRRVEGHERDADQVRIGVEIDDVDLLVDDLRGHVGRQRGRNVQAGEHREAEDLRLPRGGPAGAHAPLRRRGIDQQELQSPCHAQPPRPKAPPSTRGPPTWTTLRRVRRRS